LGNLSGNHSLSVIGKQNRLWFEAFLLLSCREERLDDLRRKFAGFFDVNPKQLVQPARYPAFGGGWAMGHLENRVGIDAGLVQQFQQPVPVGIFACHANDSHPETKPSQVVGDIAGASRVLALPLMAQDKDWRFLGDAAGCAKQVTIEHQIANDQHICFMKALVEKIGRNLRISHLWQVCGHDVSLSSLSLMGSPLLDYHQLEYPLFMHGWYGIS
jgi:hypothetical protein